MVYVKGSEKVKFVEEFFDPVFVIDCGVLSKTNCLWYYSPLKDIRHHLLRVRIHGSKNKDLQWKVRFNKIKNNLVLKANIN